MTFLKSKHTSLIALAFALALSTVAMIAQAPLQCASAHASDTLPTDYCISIEIDVTNNTGSTLTNYPVRAELTALALQGNSVLDPRGWDVVAGIGSISSEVVLVEQDLDVNDAPWWLVIPSIPDGATQTVTLWMGNGEARRDQAMFFSGDTEIRIDGLDANAYTANPQVEMWIWNYDDTARTETIYDQSESTGSGAVISWQDVGGALTMGFELDSAGRCDLTWNPAWNDTWTKVTAYWSSSVGVDIDIYVNDTVTQLCNEGHGNASNPSDDTIIGDGEYGPLSGSYIRSIGMCAQNRPNNCGEVHPNFDFQYLVNFDANNMSENISSVLPYQGTIVDGSGNAVDITYTVNDSQANIDVVVNSPTLTSLTVGAVVDEDLVDITGQVLPDDIFDPIVKDTSSPFYEFVIQPLENLFPQDWQGPTLAMFAIGIVAALWVAQKTDWEYPAIYLTVIGLLPGFGAYNGWVPWPFVLLWALVIFFQWTGVIRLIKESF